VTQAQELTQQDWASNSVASILTAWEPFGPLDSEKLFNPGLVGTEVLFDRSNLIYAQAANVNRPTYIVGRKGAGKTAFLRASAVTGDQPQVCLDTANVYSEMYGLLRNHAEARGPLFVAQTAEIWLALFEHVAVLYAVNSASADDPPVELQVLYDYVITEPDWRASGHSRIAGYFIAELNRRIADPGIHGLHSLIDGMTRGGITFAEVRLALRVVLAGRDRPLMIVMDNLEDMQSQMAIIQPAVAGLFHAVGRMAGQRHEWPFALQICLPSELWDQLHVISANPEKDFAGNYLTIFWTASELLHLAATRYRIFMELHHKPQLSDLMRRTRGSDQMLLRAALPPTIRNGLGIEEDPIAYLMRHTQLLPRHLIEILNRVFTASARQSVPWAVTENAIRSGTRQGEIVIIKGIFSAHQASYPYARDVLKRMANRLDICFEARALHKVFNQEGIKKLTGGDYDDFLSMLITMGILGVKVGETVKYNNAEFQYTFDSILNAQEDADQLCFHPLFTRLQFEHSLKRLIKQGQRPTYPYGTDTDAAERDYRTVMGPYVSGRR
jgi:hypothetical protein